jgi:hypothetical protein
MLKHNFKFYVPSKRGKLFDPSMQRLVYERVVDEFVTMFGGCTETQAVGHWQNEMGDMVHEAITQVESFTDGATFNTHTGDVFALAEEMCRVAGQESIALEVDGVLHLVSAAKVESQAEALPLAKAA